MVRDTLEKPLPQARNYLAIAAVDGKIHVIGGRTGTRHESVNRHDIYDIASNTWSAGPPRRRRAAAPPRPDASLSFKRIDVFDLILDAHG